MRAELEYKKSQMIYLLSVFLLNLFSQRVINSSTAEEETVGCFQWNDSTFLSDS